MSWRYWWRYNRLPYLDHRARLRAAAVTTGSDEFYLGRGQGEQRAAGVRPGERRVQAEVAPLLRELLASETSSHILTSAMLSLAKFGEQPGAREEPTRHAIEPFLAHPNETVAEVAALSLGILGSDACAPPLAHVLFDDASGRELCGGRAPARVRAMAAYGLALVGERSPREDVQRFAVSSLTRAFDREEGATRDVEVACLLGVGLVPLPPCDPPAGAAPLPSRGLADQVRWCQDILERDERGSLTQAHVPTTLARLVALAPEHSDERLRVTALLLDAIAPSSRAPRELRQSAAQALGFLADADEDVLDQRVRTTLESTYARDADQGTRLFALMSLAHIGSRAGGGQDPWVGTGPARAFLLKQISRGKSFARPWAVLSLALLERRLEDAGVGRAAESEVAIRTVLRSARAPEMMGACCLALGLLRDDAAAGDVLAVLDRADPETRVYAVLALGMMHATATVERLEQELRSARYQPRLVWSIAVARALMRDENVVPGLLAMLEESSSLATRGAVCFALGHVGDASAVTALMDMARDGSVPDQARGIAAEALGLLGERTLLPWNTSLSVGTNYYANPATLSSPSGDGVLDLM